MGNLLFLEERRRAILQRLEDDGRVTVRDLSAMMGVSAVTILQDLRALEEEGLLESDLRRRGGAHRDDAAQRAGLNVACIKQRAEKRALAAFAARFVANGASVALDSSTSVYALLPYLKRLEKLTVVTNCLCWRRAFSTSRSFRCW